MSELYYESAATRARRDRETIDRLTRERDEARAEARRAVSSQMKAQAIMKEQHGNMVRLRAAIEGAPHAEDCYWVRGRESVMSAEKHCNCWKRRALEGATTEEKSE